jgi:hypothetical protein
MRQALIAMILAASLWSFFANLWNPIPPPTTDAGCSADPWGCPGS